MAAGEPVAVQAARRLEEAHAMATQVPGASRPAYRAMLRDLQGRVAFAAVMLILGVCFLTASAAGAVLAWALPRRMRAPCGRTIMRRGFRFCIALMRATGFCHFDLRALEALRDARGLVIAPNHPTLFDVVLIVSQVPNVVCVTKASLWNNPLLGGMVRLAGFIRNDAPLQLVRRAAAELRAGSNLLIFPEGTRTPANGRLGPFRPGFALMAKAGGAPVQAVFLSMGTPYLRKGWPLLRQPPLPLAYGARLGRRFPTGGEAVGPFVERLEAYYCDELAAPALAVTPLP